MKITMVCWGNICRSPMAERVLQKLIEESTFDASEFSLDSVGISSEEVGNPMDHRAVHTLRAAGYNPDGHRARQVTKAMIESTDVFVAAESFHLDRLRALGAQEHQLCLMTDFDPDSQPGAPLPDPWYGDSRDFEETLAVLERAMPRLLAKVTE